MPPQIVRQPFRAAHPQEQRGERSCSRPRHSLFGSPGSQVALQPRQLPFRRPDVSLASDKDPSAARVPFHGLSRQNSTRRPPNSAASYSRFLEGPRSLGAISRKSPLAPKLRHINQTWDQLLGINLGKPQLRKRRYLGKMGVPGFRSPLLSSQLISEDLLLIIVKRSPHVTETTRFFRRLIYSGRAVASLVPM